VNSAQAQKAVPVAPDDALLGRLFRSGAALIHECHRLGSAYVTSAEVLDAKSGTLDDVVNWAV